MAGTRPAMTARIESTEETTMKRADLTEKVLDIKREKGWTWTYICGEIGGMSPVLVTAEVRIF